MSAISLATVVEGEPVLQFTIEGQDYRRFRHYYLRSTKIAGCGMNALVHRYEYLLLPPGSEEEEEKIDAFLARELPAFLRDHPEYREE